MPLLQKYLALVSIPAFLLTSSKTVIVNDEGCGLVASNRILGGEFAKDSEFAWTVSIWEKRYIRFLSIWINIEDNQICTGSIISSRLVLTAAHCGPTVDQESDLFYTWTRSLGKNYVQSFHIHPNYSSVTFFNDIMLMYMDEEFPLSAKLRPPCVATCGMPLRKANEMIAAGYGVVANNSHRLVATHLRLSRLTVLGFGQRNICGMEMIVLKPTNRTSALCFGDSGGPLTHKLNSSIYVAGVYSLTSQTGCRDDAERYFSGVSYHYEFLMYTAERLHQ